MFDEIISSTMKQEDNSVIIEIVSILERVASDLDIARKFILENLSKQCKIGLIRKNFRINLKRENLKAQMRVSLQDYLMNNKELAKDFLNDLNLDQHSSLNNPESLTVCSEAVFTSVVDLANAYESYSGEGEPYLLIEAFVSEAKKEFRIKELQEQAQILGEGLHVGRNFFVGTQGQEEYKIVSAMQYHNRFDGILEDSAKVQKLTSYEEVRKAEENEQVSEFISTYGIEPLDRLSEIRTQQIITIVGTEGVGKTFAMMHIVSNILYAGKSVAVMAGESTLQKIRSMYISWTIYERTGHRFSFKEVATLKRLTKEQVDLIEKEKSEIFDDDSYGKLSIHQSFTYETFYDDIARLKMSNPDLSVVAIDHTSSLQSSGGMTKAGFLRSKNERIEFLYSQMIELKRDFNITFIVLSHTGSTGIEELKRGKDPTIRSGANSSATSKDTDVFLNLYDDESLKAEKKAYLKINKLRDDDDTAGELKSILRKEFDCCRYSYSDDDQAIDIKNMDMDMIV